MSEILIPGLSSVTQLASADGMLGDVVLDDHYPVVRVALGPITAAGLEGQGVLTLVDPDVDAGGPGGLQSPWAAGTRSFALFSSSVFAVRSPFNSALPTRVRFLGAPGLAGTSVVVQGFRFPYGEL